MKPLGYTRHAIDVIAEREIDAAWVEATVRQPEWTSPDPHRPEVTRCFRAVAEREGRILRVAVVELDEEIRILSAFLDRGAARPK